MYVDKQNEFSDSQVITVAAISTNVIDTMPSSFSQSTVQNLGGPVAPFLILQVDVPMLAAGAATLQVTLESDSTANLATAPVVHWSSAQIAKALLIPGFQIIVPFPIDATVKRYVGLRYTPTTGPFTAGAMSAFLARDVQNWRGYATGSASNL